MVATVVPGLSAVVSGIMSVITATFVGCIYVSMNGNTEPEIVS